jgi:hypothetical protein
MDAPVFYGITRCARVEVSKLSLKPAGARGTIQTAIYGERLADVVGQLIIPEASIQNLIDQTLGRRPRLRRGLNQGRIREVRLGSRIVATDALAHHCVRTSISPLLGRQEAPSTIV